MHKLKALLCPFISIMKILITSGTWKILSGNEIGALLGWWSYFTFKQSDHSKTVDGP